MSTSHSLMLGGAVTSAVACLVAEKVRSTPYRVVLHASIELNRSYFTQSLVAERFHDITVVGINRQGNNIICGGAMFAFGDRCRG